MRKQLSSRVEPGTFLLEPIGIDGHVKSKKRQIFSDKCQRQIRIKEPAFRERVQRYSVMPFIVLPKCGIYIKPVQLGEQFWIGCDDEANREFMNVPDFNPARCHSRTLFLPERCLSHSWYLTFLCSGTKLRAAAGQVLLPTTLWIIFRTFSRMKI